MLVPWFRDVCLSEDGFWVVVGVASYVCVSGTLPLRARRLLTAFILLVQG